MLSRACRLHVAVVTRVLPFLRRTISGSSGEEALRPLSLSSSDSASETEGEESVPHTHQPQVLQAYLRNRRARCLARVREQGLVPAVLVDGEEDRRAQNGFTDVFLSLDARPLVSLLKFMGKRDFISRIFDMNIYRYYGSSEIQESLQVLPRNLNYGPGKTNILNVQFVRATPGQTLKLGVPLEYLSADQCPGLKKGGTLKKLAKYVVYNCKATEVPAKIVVDMSVLEIGDRVQVQDLEVNFDILYSDRTMPVCEIVKDVNTLKAKAKRLKNELYHKKRALDENESRSISTSFSDDEVDVNLGQDKQVSTRVRSQRGARQDLSIRRYMSRVLGSKRKGKALESRRCLLSDDEVDVSDEEGKEVSARFQRQCLLSGDEVDVSNEDVPTRLQRQRDAQMELPIKNSISRVTESTRKGKESGRRICSLSDDEVDTDDDENEEVSTRFQMPEGIQKQSSVKVSFSRVASSLKNGKLSKQRVYSLPDDKVDDEDEAVFTRFRRQRETSNKLLDRNSIKNISGSMRKGEVSERKLSSLSDDEGDVNYNKGEEVSSRSRRQRGAHKELCSKNSISRVSGCLKKGKASKRRLVGTPYKLNKPKE